MSHAIAALATAELNRVSRVVKVYVDNKLSIFINNLICLPYCIAVTVDSRWLEPSLELEPLSNSNQNRFPLNFLHTFTVILPSAATRALVNSNLSVTRSNFCFPSDHFHIIPLNNSEQCFECLKSREKQYTSVRNIEFWISYWRVVGWCCLSQT